MFGSKEQREMVKVMDTSNHGKVSRRMNSPIDTALFLRLPSVDGFNLGAGFNKFLYWHDELAYH